ncbi:MAG: hypothetical protein JWP29_463 [Rhodoferax sp.]|nr:hypothetical protein [Rhodoferax sp.]
MALDRIPPLGRTTPLLSARSPVQPASTASATAMSALATLARTGDAPLRLLVAESPNGGLLGRSADGRSFRLDAAATNPADALLQPGQVLMVRIVRTSPTLELMVLGSAGAQDGAADFSEAGTKPPRILHTTLAEDADPAALRTDQAYMRRLTRAVIEPPLLASNWRTLVVAQLQRAATVPAWQGVATDADPQPGAERRLPLSSAALAVADDIGVPTRAREALLALRLQAWSDMPVTLWLVPRGAAYHGANRRRARRNGVRLRLSIEHAAWGPVDIEVDVLDATVALTLTAALAHAVAPLRHSVNAILQRLIAAGLRLVRCRVEQAPPRPEDHTAMSTGADTQALASHQAAGLTAAELPLVLFRAATEVLAALSPPSR